jgi:hypothetical protein
VKGLRLSTHQEQATTSEHWLGRKKSGAHSQQCVVTLKKYRQKKGDPRLLLGHFAKRKLFFKLNVIFFFSLFFSRTLQNTNYLSRRIDRCLMARYIRRG